MTNIEMRTPNESNKRFHLTFTRYDTNRRRPEGTEAEIL